MALTTIASLLNDSTDPSKPPKPPQPPQSGAAFQRRLQEQRALARHEVELSRSATAGSANASASQRQSRQPPQRQILRQSAERDAYPSPGGLRRQNPEDVDGSPFLAGAYGEGGRGHGGAGSGAGGQGGMAGSPSGQVDGPGDGELECDILLELLPADGDSGIFELLMPGGDTLAVVADIGKRQASFLLTPSSERLRGMLKKRKMELENGLTQRMERHVRLTVL